LRKGIGGMKVLLSSIGSRGDVQPILALALELKSLGHEARLCVAPNFQGWVESLGIPCVSIGPDLRKLTASAPPGKIPKPKPGQLRQFAAHAVQSQFPVVMGAAHGCDLIVAAGTLQFAAHSVAEALRIPYMFAGYCPAIFPSPGHPPPKMGSHHSQSLLGIVNRFLWRQEQRHWDELFLQALNDERAKLGLAPVERMLRHVFTDDPWLAADATIAPCPASTPGLQVTQTGAWLLSNPTPLPDHLESFLASGEPPVYFGFGSMRAGEHTSRMLIEAARAIGMRSIISQGWGNLAPIDAGTDCISIGDVDHEKLLPRVAVIVHHGGAGTTTAAARAGRPQVVVPHLYDQFYWAHRVKKLGIGIATPSHEHVTSGSLADTLRKCLHSAIGDRAHAVSRRIESSGARHAAQQLCGTTHPS
jgi:vancomycin aglycone glucosyltransferase